MISTIGNIGNVEENEKILLLDIVYVRMYDSNSNEGMKYKNYNTYTKHTYFYAACFQITFNSLKSFVCMSNFMWACKLQSALWSQH